ncbi:hypothetical protein SOPP22_02930 [Shewanella sp. OPT22]|nr:hypothetical protein SOPP22_02930 [Shewanella sp. OPT22]
MKFFIRILAFIARKIKEQSKDVKLLKSLFPYTDLQSYSSLEVQTENIELYPIEDISNTRTELDPVGRGIHVNASELLKCTQIEVEYSLSFSIKDTQYVLRHFMLLEDYKTPASLYESYFFSNVRECHQLYSLLEALSYKITFTLVKQFYDHFDGQVSFIDTLGTEVLDDLKQRITLIESFDYGT